MVVRPHQETRVSPPPPPPPPPPSSSSLPPDVESTATLRLYGWRRKSYRNRIALIVPVIIFCGLLIVAGAYYMASKQFGENFRIEIGPPVAGSLSAKQESVIAWLGTNVPDPNFEVVEWSPLVGKQHEEEVRLWMNWELYFRGGIQRYDAYEVLDAPFLFVKIRYRTAFGGYGISTWLVDFEKGTDRLSSVLPTRSAWPNHIWNEEKVAR